MSTVNDEKILKLRKQIEEKESALKGTERFSPITTCSIELYGVRQNIQVLTIEQLEFLYVQLYLLKQGAMEVGYDLKISGFALDSWLKDVKSKIAVLSRNEEVAKLNRMKQQLESMLSDDKQKEMKIDEIADLLK